MTRNENIFALLLIFIISACTGCHHAQEKTSLIHPHTSHSSFNHRNKKVVLVGGCFDILHHGHIQFLENASKQGDFLIVALEPDEKIIKQKKRNPIHTQKIRAYNLASLRYVDEILLLPVLTTYEDYATLVNRVKPNIIAVTRDDPQIQNKMNQAHKVNAQVVVVSEKLPNLSTTLIIEKCTKD